MPTQPQFIYIGLDALKLPIEQRPPVTRYAVHAQDTGALLWEVYLSADGAQAFKPARLPTCAVIYTPETLPRPYAPSYDAMRYHLLKQGKAAKKAMAENTPMTDNQFLQDLERAKYFMQYDDEHAEFWRGYAFGLHRGHDGPRFDDDKHTARLANDGDLGKGYRAGLQAFATGKRWTWEK